jgi:protein-S-isoprenylcysteine O-methyltransferase Ste14
MPPLFPTRRAPWLAGALLLAFAVGLVAPVAHSIGWARWPYLVGLAAAILLLFGALERLWQRRPLPRTHRVADRTRFRIVPGGKGNGHAKDTDKDDGGDKPRWVM